MSSCVCSASPVSVCPLYGTPSSNDAGFGFSPLMCPVAKLDLISLIAFANDIVLPSRTNSNVSCSAFSPAADTLSAASGDDAESSTDLTMCLMYLKRQPFSFRHASAASLSTAASAAATQFLPVTCVERSSAPFLSLPVIGKTRPRAAATTCSRRKRRWAWLQAGGCDWEPAGLELTLAKNRSRRDDGDLGRWRPSRRPCCSRAPPLPDPTISSAHRGGRCSSTRRAPPRSAFPAAPCLADATGKGVLQFDEEGKLIEGQGVQEETSFRTVRAGAANAQLLDEWRWASPGDGSLSTR